MTDPHLQCSFCNQTQSGDHPLIAGMDGHICESCVRLAAQVVDSWVRKRSMSGPMEKLPVPREIKRQLDQYVVGQDDAKLTLAVAVYNHYKRFQATANAIGSPINENRVEVEKSNILLLGASGTGKTLLATTLARIVGVPFAIADATTLTQAGYVGDDVESIISRLLDAADGNRERAEWGIVYIDEIDKLARAAETAHATRDVSGEGVQQALLKLVEGTSVKLAERGRKDRDGLTFDTTNVLFMAGGAFSGLEAILARRIQHKSKSIGFDAVLAGDGDVRSNPEILAQTGPDDLRHFGLIPEFIGRFPVITALHDLAEAELVRILTEPRNALVKQYQELFGYEGVQLTFEPAALTTIAQRAVERGTGARGLRSVLEELLKEPMYNLPSEAGVTGCWVNEAAVRGEVLVRRDSFPIPEEPTLDEGAEDVDDATAEVAAGRG